MVGFVLDSTFPLNGFFYSKGWEALTFLFFLAVLFQERGLSVSVGFIYF